LKPVERAAELLAPWQSRALQDFTQRTENCRTLLGELCGPQPCKGCPDENSVPVPATSSVAKEVLESVCVSPHKNHGARTRRRTPLNCRPRPGVSHLATIERLQAKLARLSEDYSSVASRSCHSLASATSGLYNSRRISQERPFHQGVAQEMVLSNHDTYALTPRSRGSSCQQAKRCPARTCTRMPTAECDPLASVDQALQDLKRAMGEAPRGTARPKLSTSHGPVVRNQSSPRLCQGVGVAGFKSIRVARAGTGSAGSSRPGSASAVSGVAHGARPCSPFPSRKGPHRHVNSPMCKTTSTHGTCITAALTADTNALNELMDLEALESTSNYNSKPCGMHIQSPRPDEHKHTNDGLASCLSSFALPHPSAALIGSALLAD